MIPPSHDERRQNRRRRWTAVAWAGGAGCCRLSRCRPTPWMPRLHASSPMLLGGRAATFLRSATGGRRTVVQAAQCRCSHGLTHLSTDGKTPQMVDVSQKAVTTRTAVARSEVELPPAGRVPAPHCPLARRSAHYLQWC
jgi:hypothetical protein